MNLNRELYLACTDLDKIKELTRKYRNGNAELFVIAWNFFRACGITHLEFDNMIEETKIYAELSKLT